jgi:hypothetical protein
VLVFFRFKIDQKARPSQNVVFPTETIDFDKVVRQRHS